MERIGAVHTVGLSLDFLGLDILVGIFTLRSRESWGTNREKDSACMGWMISDALAMLQIK